MVSDHYVAALSAIDARIVDTVPPGGNWRDLPDDFPSQRVQQIKSGVNGGSRSTYYGRLLSEKPAYTISTYFTRPGNGCFIHPHYGRLISIREAARLQSFPDSIRFTGPTRSRCQQIGNAVPPLLSFNIASIQPPGQFVDLFCGVGGLGLGFEWAGFEMLLGVDNDRHALNSLQLNAKREIGFAANLADYEEVTRARDEIRSKTTGRLSFLLGGPPCQGFSTAGKNSDSDVRNKLVWQYLRLVNELQPDSMLMENVPALLWGKNKGTLEEIRNELHKMGYFTSVAVLHGEAYGVPQLRRRLFILGSKYKERLRWPLPLNAVTGYSMKNLQPFAETGVKPPVNVWEAISDLPEVTAPSPDDLVTYATNSTSAFQSWIRAGGTPPSPFISGAQTDEYPLESQPSLYFAI